jgi:hypothetical protein
MISICVPKNVCDTVYQIISENIGIVDRNPTFMSFNHFKMSLNSLAFALIGDFSGGKCFALLAADINRVKASFLSVKD